jgi:hypothetical protein
MLKKKLLLLIALVLIAAFGYSFNGPDSSGIVLLGKDTFALVPIQSIKAANSVKAMNDEEKILFDSLDRQVKDLKIQRDTLQAQKDLFKQTSDTCRRVGDDLVKRNAKLIVENMDLKKQVSNDRIAIAVAIIIIVLETAILVY